MKKVLLLLLAFGSFAFAQDAISGADMVKAYSAAGAIIGLGLAALGGAIGIGNLSAATVSGIARNPGLSGKLMGTMFLTFALIEAQVIYALVVSLMLLFANPFI